MKKIAIAADHGGYELKEVLKKHYAGQGVDFMISAPHRRLRSIIPIMPQKWLTRFFREKPRSAF